MYINKLNLYYTRASLISIYSCIVMAFIIFVIKKNKDKSQR